MVKADRRSWIISASF